MANTESNSRPSVGPPGLRISTNNSPGANNLIDCPYDKTHKVPLHSMKAHLNRCHIYHTEVETFPVCGFTSTHRVLSKNLEEHMRHCPDNHSRLLGERTPSTNVNGSSDLDMHPAEENWDNEPFHPTYDPTVANRDKVLILKRKNFAKPKK